MESQMYLKLQLFYRVNPAEILKPRPDVHLWGRCLYYSHCTEYKLGITYLRTK